MNAGTPRPGTKSPLTDSTPFSHFWVACDLLPAALSSIRSLATPFLLSVASEYAWLSALGWETAQGSGFAIARIAAEGPLAFAQHANDPIARQMLADPHAEQTQMIILAVITVFSLVLIAYYAWAVRRRLGGRARSNPSRSG